MRDQVLTYLGSENLGSFSLTQNLPYDNSGIALYLKNPKSVYVGKDQETTEIFIGILGSDSIDMQIDSVTVYFTNDAKTLPSDYYDVINTIKAAKSLYASNGYFKRDVQLDTEFENDLITTIIELKYYKLIS